MRFFIATYTNRVKDYCDTEFFSNLHKLSKGHPVMVVDNTLDDTYTERIATLTHAYPNFDVSWIMVPKEPHRTLFLRNVAESVSMCRDAFLKSNCDHMLIIESDVLPPVTLLDKLEEDILFLEGEKWGIIGGIYYRGFHNYDLKGLHQTRHVLSGCSVYNGEMIKETPFRWSEENINAFPDAWMSMDAERKGFSMWNDHDVVCEHLTAPNGGRYSAPL